MLEAAAFDIVASQRIQHGLTVLREAAVFGRIDAQRRQCHKYLRVGLAVCVAPACKTAVCELQAGEHGQCLVHSGLDGLIAGVVGRERLNCHRGHVRVSEIAVQRPAAVGQRSV